MQIPLSQPHDCFFFSFLCRPVGVSMLTAELRQHENIMCLKRSATVLTSLLSS